MKKYLFSFGVATLLLLTGCSQKNTNGSVMNTTTDGKITSLDQKDLLSESSIHDAVRVNDSKLVDFFIEEKVNLNAQDRFGYTPLHLASRFNHLDIAQKLIDNGASVNSVDKFGDTPLIDSTRNGYSQMSKLLICNGAERNVADKYKMTPLHYASKTNNISIAKLLRADDVKLACETPKATPAPVVKESFYDLITMDDYSVINDNTPKICGDILDSDVQQVQLSFDGGQTVTEGIIQENRWCAQVEDEIVNGDYTAMAMAINSKRQKGKAQDDLTIHVLNDLYEALNKEFSPDFEAWNAELEKDTLTFRFKKPSLMFTRGSSKIKTDYKEILNSFFPRYINILKDYKDEVKSVHVEGHTSSRFRTAKTDQEKFEKNRVLSQNRAEIVLGYLKSVTDNVVVENAAFINNAFEANGMSSSKTIYNADGSENYELSRRVEFRIETVPNK